MNMTVDSSVWISAMFPREVWYPEASMFLLDMFAGLHQVAVPATVLTEIVCATARRCKEYGIDPNRAVEYGESLRSCPNIVWKTVDQAFAREAAICGRMFGLRGMDALVASTALYYGVPLLASDGDFRVLEPSVYVMTLMELKDAH